MHIGRILYPTYGAYSAKCLYTGAMVLNETACCPLGSSPKGQVCVPDDDLLAYHDGSGDYVNHFITVTKLRCIGMGLVWNANTSRCIT